MIRGLISLCILIEGACGYRFGSLQEHTVLAVGMFENRTEWRDREFDLTRQLIREMSRQGILVDSGADLELRGEILNLQEAMLVSDSLDNPRASSFAMKVHFRVVRRISGATVSEGDVSESEVFSPLRGQSLDSAQAELLDRLCRSIVSKLEKGW